ncbi:hypothetical protein [Pseudochrobactrum asaccharolyticum]|uniref:Cellulose biosynthesis protein BcsQ n=1 Tax=Pseudochrobactrum asaccharolyticum TaxID=354351 RepID=A0A366DLG2_9HYPH|nr:hypothetical protein [Pseudochrobactrum asaccharolyticum]RBO90920.1 hypothetical protein DFR47_11115 [Pseudochrobactrum asaccharolyticum]
MRSIIIANKTGGVGKTTISELFNIYLDKHDHQFSLFSIEGQGSNIGYMSSLKRAVPHTKDVFVQSPHQYGVANQKEFLEIWSDVLEPVFKGSCIVDFGANALAGYQHVCALFENGRTIWRDQEAENGFLKPVIVIPVTANHNSHYDTVDLLQWLFTEDGMNNFHHVVLVSNDLHGPVNFEEDLQELISANSSKISLIDLERNQSEFGMRSLSEGMVKMRKFLNASREVGNEMMRSSMNLYDLAAIRSMDRWLESFEYELEKIQLLNLLKHEMPVSASEDNGTESVIIRFE